MVLTVAIWWHQLLQLNWVRYEVPVISGSLWQRWKVLVISLQLHGPTDTCSLKRGSWVHELCTLCCHLFVFRCSGYQIFLFLPKTPPWRLHHLYVCPGQSLHRTLGHARLYDMTHERVKACGLCLWYSPTYQSDSLPIKQVLMGWQAGPLCKELWPVTTYPPWQEGVCWPDLPLPSLWAVWPNSSISSILEEATSMVVS